MAAGEMIAVVLEQLKEYDNSDEWEPDDDLILKLKELATDSHKFRAKKDRKTQRSVFRDIIRYVEVVIIISNIYINDLLLVHIANTQPFVLGWRVSKITSTFWTRMFIIGYVVS